MYTGNTQIDNVLKKMEAFFDMYLGQKAPALPMNIKEFIVRFGPWVLVAGLILGFFGLFASFGVSFINLSFLFLLSSVLMLVILVMEALAVPGLLKRKKKSWYLVYYATLLGFIFSLLVSNIVGALVFTLLGLYILFQIKSLYTSR